MDWPPRPRSAADYDKTEKSPLCELHLRVPATAMAIVSLKDKILALYNADADDAKSDAKDDKEGNPSFHPYSIDTVWRVTFENDAVLSLSGETNADTGGAHPNQAFQTLVWDKKANRAVPIGGAVCAGPGQSRLERDRRRGGQSLDQDLYAAHRSAARTRCRHRRRRHRRGPGKARAFTR